MVSAALTSFLTGITEPLEFSFLFLAPLLYGVHALIRVHLSREEELYADVLDSAAWPAEG